jgi:hypothetical protein
MVNGLVDMVNGLVGMVNGLVGMVNDNIYGNHIIFKFLLYKQ